MQSLFSVRGRVLLLSGLLSMILSPSSSFGATQNITGADGTTGTSPAGTGGNDFSSKTVQFYIKEIVAAEDAKKILSDDAIVTLLKDRNIDVARRTVTKYREEMNIPSSVVRRRQKNGK